MNKRAEELFQSAIGTALAEMARVRCSKADYILGLIMLVDGAQTAKYAALQDAAREGRNEARA